MELTITGSFSIETEDGFGIHPKVIDLLDEVEKTGSLNSAVQKVGMSYSYAWNMIHKANCNLEMPILITKRGGTGGGIATLTDAGKTLLNYCKQLEKDFKNFIGTHKVEL